MKIYAFLLLPSLSIVAAGPALGQSDESKNFVSDDRNSSLCQGLEGGSWVHVPADPDYGTSEFCVQKYMTSEVGGLPVAQVGTFPWDGIVEKNAKSACAALGAGYHLVNNDEWMTIASNIAGDGRNWSGGSVGSGELTRGHSDTNKPFGACPANEDDRLAYLKEQNECVGIPTGTFNQRRTFYLSNNEVIWDMSGGWWQRVDHAPVDEQPSSASDVFNRFTEYSAPVRGTASMPITDLIPTMKPWWRDTWNSSQSIGRYAKSEFKTVSPLPPLVRGGTWNHGPSAGVFSALFKASDVLYPDNVISVSFRCAWKP